VTIEPANKEILSASKHTQGRNMFVEERFLSTLLEETGGTSCFN